MSILANLIDMYKRSVAKQPLTAQQRAFLKGVFGLFVGILGSLVPQLPGVLSGAVSLNIGWTLGCIVVCILCLAVAKLWDAATPQEIAIGQLMEYYAEEIEAIVEGSLAVKQMPKLIKPNKNQTQPLPHDPALIGDAPQ
jgi:hypothetical protein